MLFFFFLFLYLPESLIVYIVDDNNLKNATNIYVIRNNTISPYNGLNVVNVFC